MLTHLRPVRQVASCAPMAGIYYTSFINLRILRQQRFFLESFWDLRRVQTTCQAGLQWGQQQGQGQQQRGSSSNSNNSRGGVRAATAAAAAAAVTAATAEAASGQPQQQLQQQQQQQQQQQVQQRQLLYDCFKSRFF